MLGDGRKHLLNFFQPIESANRLLGPTIRHPVAADFACSIGLLDAGAGTAPRVRCMGEQDCTD